MTISRRGGLYATVFLTGAAVLVIEVTALRLLSPQFGNTIFTASSVIGVILAALSIGYALGGRLADRHPEPRWFFGIIMVSGASVLFLHFLSVVLLPWLGESLSLTSGPLVSALLLFLLPGVLLGTLSPFAVALQKVSLPEQGVGSTAGNVFFWSTLGSIFGSFLAGFVLIPRLGVSVIVLGTGVLLLLLGALPWWFLRKERGSLKPLIWLLALGAMGWGSLSLDAALQSPATLYEDDGVYEHLRVFEGYRYNRSARFFTQDKSLSGAIFTDTDEDVFEYTKYHRLYRLLGDGVDRALVLGGGIYTVPRELLAEQPDALVDVAEIEPQLMALARQFFYLPETDRLRNHIEDGRRFLRETEEEYDLIFSDVYQSLYSVPSHMATREFFALAKSRLAPEGIFIANLIGSLADRQPSFLLSELRTFQEVFPNMAVFAMISSTSEEVQNVIVAGTTSKRNLVDLARSASSSSESSLVSLDTLNLSSHPVFTDDYAPVDYFLASIFEQ